jgi:gamma-glutamylcyclotransferase (GGCT)/AIG2-like uncharacterized protein YtfP
MTTPQAGRTEATGAKFSLQSMQHARTLSQRAVRQIASGMRPGITHAQAHDLAMATLHKLEMERNWHPIVIRFGQDTLKTFREQSDPASVLGAQDIYFIDIGPVWEGHEGDAGDTFVTGDDPQMHACAEAARTLWHDVAARWRADRLSGEALYAYAAERAEAMGWRLNLDIKGHRVCDFPHAIYQAGRLGDFGLCPGTGIWILEIQIAHPTRPFGAFYEDLLMADDEAHTPATQATQAATEQLFSYGTLQLQSVQVATFGRRLDGQLDSLPGYRLEQLEIKDPAVVATSGKTHHPIVAPSGNTADRVDGAVFALTPAELAHADAYEVDDYRRERVTLASGLQAWAYVDARSHPGR